MMLSLLLLMSFLPTVVIGQSLISIDELPSFQVLLLSTRILNQSILVNMNNVSDTPSDPNAVLEYARNVTSQVDTFINALNSSNATVIGFINTTQYRQLIAARDNINELAAQVANISGEQEKIKTALDTAKRDMDHLNGILDCFSEQICPPPVCFLLTDHSNVCTTTFAEYRIDGCTYVFLSAIVELFIEILSAPNNCSSQPVDVNATSMTAVILQSDGFPQQTVGPLTCNYTIRTQPINIATLQFNVEYVFISGNETNGNASIVIANSDNTLIFRCAVLLTIVWSR